MISIKSPREIELMRKAGKVVAGVFKEIEPHILPGVSTLKIANICEKYIRSKGATPTFKGYGGFKGSVCTSVNDIIIHGIPSKTTILKEGDVISVDVGATLNGYNGDACRTYRVGKVDAEAENLIKTTEESFFYAVSFIKPGVHLGDICNAVQEYNESRGYYLIKDYTGHGIGNKLHEDPMIPNYGKKRTGPILREGMTICVEPMVSIGSDRCVTLKDGWAVKMTNNKKSAHYENTILVTKDGYELLTIMEETNGKN